MMRFFWEAAGAIDAMFTIVIFCTILYREGIWSLEKLVTCMIATFSSFFFAIAWSMAGFERSYTAYHQLSTFIMESVRTAMREPNTVIAD